MKFYIGTDNGSGQKFGNKAEFLTALVLMIEDCEANGGTQFDVTVDADASCFSEPEVAKTDSAQGKMPWYFFED